MEILKIGKITGGIELYSDPYMEENKFTRGRREDQTFFIVTNPKTAKKIFNAFQNIERRNKLNKINAI